MAVFTGVMLNAARGVFPLRFFELSFCREKLSCFLSASLKIGRLIIGVWALFSSGKKMVNLINALIGVNCPKGVRCG